MWGVLGCLGVLLSRARHALVAWVVVSQFSRGDAIEKVSTKRRGARGVMVWVQWGLLSWFSGEFSEVSMRAIVKFLCIVGGGEIRC